MKPIQSHKYILITAIVFVAIVAFVYGYMYSAIGGYAGNITDVKERLHSEEELRSQGRAIKALYAETAQDRAELSKLFVLSDKAVDLIMAVEALGPLSGSKVSISTIDKKINMQVVATGSWVSVMKTLVLSEDLPYASAIDSVRLDASTKDIWTLSFQLHAATL